VTSTGKVLMKSLSRRRTGVSSGLFEAPKSELDCWDTEMITSHPYGKLG